MTPIGAIPSSNWERLPDLPSKLGLAGAFAGVADGYLLVAGGANFPDQMPWDGGIKKWHDTVYALDKPDGAWSIVGQLPIPLGYGVSVTTTDGIFCVGGSDSQRHYGNVFRLTWKRNKFTTENAHPLPIALANHCGALVGTTLYVVGGNEKPGEVECVNRAFTLDLSNPTARWIEIPSLPGKPRFLSTAGAHDGTLFIVGGTSLESNPNGKISRSYLKEIWSYRPDQGWILRAPMLKPAVAAPTPAPVLAGRLLILTGDDGSLAQFQPLAQHPGFPCTIQSYDTSNDSWNFAGELPTGRAVLPCVQWQEKTVIISGEQRPGVRTPEILAGKLN